MNTNPEPRAIDACSATFSLKAFWQPIFSTLSFSRTTFGRHSGQHDGELVGQSSKCLSAKWFSTKRRGSDVIYSFSLLFCKNKLFKRFRIFRQKNICPTNILADRHFGRQAFWPTNFLADKHFGRQAFDQHTFGNYSFARHIFEYYSVAQHTYDKHTFG